MPAVNILIDIHCVRPSWALEYHKEQLLPPIYRVYVNEDLITERSWLWDDGKLIREEIWVELDTSTVHKIKLQPVLKVAGMAKFKIDNLVVDNKPAVIQDFNDLEVSFTI